MFITNFGEDGSGQLVGPQIKVLSVSNPNNDLVTGDNQVYFRVPAEMDGWKITSVAASVSTVGTVGSTTVQIRNMIAAVDVLSTAITIEVSEKDSKDAATQPVINTSNNTVHTGDQIAVDVDAVSTGARGLDVSIKFARS